VYGELASIREVVGYSPEEALDAAEAFLVQLGYVALARGATSLTVKRDEPNRVMRTSASRSDASLRSACSASAESSAARPGRALNFVLADPGFARCFVCGFLIQH
jgi:hypothetical protein